MKFALEHNLGARNVFLKIDDFSNPERKQLQLFGRRTTGAIHSSRPRPWTATSYFSIRSVRNQAQEGGWRSQC
jgi:hypothetical protein